MKKLPLILTIALAVAAFFFFDLGHYLNLDFLKANQAKFDQQVLYLASRQGCSLSPLPAQLAQHWPFYSPV
jgi:hypothetical protein